MSTAPADRPRRSSNRAATLLASFWVVDVLVVALLAFFIIVGGGRSPVAIIVGVVLAVLYAVHAVLRRRHQGERALSREAQRDRERRGF